MEVWWIGADGSVNGNYYYEDGGWGPTGNKCQLDGPGSASTSGGIAAVSKAPNHMEVWWIGADG
jgi:hypothetical protein